VTMLEHLESEVLHSVRNTLTFYIYTTIAIVIVTVGLSLIGIAIIFAETTECGTVYS